MTVRLYDSFEQQLLAEGEYVTVLMGTSMYPMVRSGEDPVVIVPLDGPLERYDVAVYRRPNGMGQGAAEPGVQNVKGQEAAEPGGPNGTGQGFVVHRVLERREDHYVIRGDNCIAKERVAPGDVVGRVSGFWRFGRFVPVTSRLYRLYSRIWVFINPLVRVNRLLLRGVRFVRRHARPSI